MLMRPRRGALVALLLLLAALPLLLAATHGPKRLTILSCGDTITTNTTLAADLGPCAGSGVSIGADHVTLNLNGHQISGSGGGVGVLSSHAGVTTENGKISGFTIGVRLEGDASRFMNMRLGHASNTGILAEGQDALVSGNRVFASGDDGIDGGGVGSQYTNNILQGNGGEGLAVVGGATSISGNKALTNGADGIGFVATQAVAVTNNIVNGNHADGVVQSPSGDPTLATVSGNKGYFNGQLGIAAAPGATDGGNNKAGSNGTSTQCTNVVCS